MNAPIRMAVTGEPGIPRVNRGIRAALAYALLAVSGAATPSFAPFPNRSGVFESRFSI